MKHFEIKANLRDDFGKKASKALRKENKIPCVLYGGNETIHFETTQADVRKFIYTPEVMFADIVIEGKTYYSILKDIQFNPVSDKIVHLDFYEITPDKVIKIAIPIKIEGTSIGVKAGGKLKQNFRKLTVKGLMNNIPDYFPVDISQLSIGQSIRIKELVSDTLEFVDSPNNILVTILSSRTSTAEDTTKAAGTK